MIVDRARVAAALPAYELGAELGSGGYGLVMAGRHRRLNREVAIKILSAVHDGAHASFESEARILAELDHPHVVRVYDYVEDDEMCLIIMELLAGGTLSRRRLGMPAEAACAVGLAAAEALSCAHAKGVLHRDVKPDNMLFDAAGLLKVTDFGIAKIFEGSATTASAVVGTPTYMAPEQITGGRLEPATDVYGLGAVLYELLAGSPPFDPRLPPLALYHHHLDTTPTPPAGVPAPAAQVVMRALAKDPAARHPSAHAFALELAEAAASSYGPQWASRSGIRLRLDDHLREVAAQGAGPPSPPRQVPLPSPDRALPLPRIPPPDRAQEPTWLARTRLSPPPSDPPPSDPLPSVPPPSVPPPDASGSRDRRSGRRGRLVAAGVLGVLGVVAGVVLTLVLTRASGTTPTVVDRASVVTLVNAERRRLGCPALATDPRLSGMAQVHAANMAEGDYYPDTIEPDGRTWEDRAATVGYRYSRWAEANARGSETPAEVVALWMSSLEARTKIVNCGFRDVGVGYALSSNSNKRPYWTLDLAVE